MSQRGNSESTQWAILTPLVLLLVLGLVQWGVWLHARTVAAEAAATVADLSGSGANAATGAGRRVAESGGLQSIEISTATHPDVVVVTVRARARMFFDFGQSLVVGQSVLPREAVR